MTLTALAEALGISKGQASKLVRRGMPAHNVAAAQRWRDAEVRPYFLPPKEAERPDPVAHTLRRVVPKLFFQPHLVALSALDAGLDLTGAQSLLLAETLMHNYMLITDAAAGTEGAFDIHDDLTASPKQRAAVVKRLDKLLAEYRPVDGRKLN